MAFIQHRQIVTLYLPIYWGTTRLSFTQLTELEPSIYVTDFPYETGYVSIPSFIKIFLLS